MPRNWEKEDKMKKILFLVVIGAFISIILSIITSPVDAHRRSSAPVTVVNDETNPIFLPAFYLIQTSGWTLPDTGQTTCYDDSYRTEFPCPNPGEPFYGQDANYTINPQSYTKLDAQGNDLPDTATEWFMVRDNLTGLIWEVKQAKDRTPDYSNPHDADNEYTWYDSNPETNRGYPGTDPPGDGTDTEDFINDLNSANFGGFSDWRIPEVRELSSILNTGMYPGAINAGYFPNTGLSDYWSSTTPPTRTHLIWRVDFHYGHIYHVGKRDEWYARAVRGGQPEPSARFVDNGDGIVTDTFNGLMWQQATGGFMDWEDALYYCEGLSLAGHDDWRLPNRNELQSLVDYSAYKPIIDTEFFPDTELAEYHSSTTSAWAWSEAWFVDFSDCLITNDRKSKAQYVRAVRSGQAALNPTQALEEVIEELQAVIDSNLGTDLADMLEDTPGDLEQAIVELDKPDKQAAVGIIEGVVGKIHDAIDKGLDPAEARELMDQLAGVARHLAVDAIDYAIDNGGDSGEINDAQNYLAEGDALRGWEEFKDAVNKYKDALAKAEGAVS